MVLYSLPAVSDGGEGPGDIPVCQCLMVLYSLAEVSDGGERPG